MSILSQFKQSQNTDFPNVRPSLDLRFALAKKLDPRITFTRGSTGTYFGSDGIMRTAGVNEPRFDHDPITGQSLGLLIEESRINQMVRSDIEGTVGAQPTGMSLAGPINGQTAVVSTDVSLGPNGQSCKHTRGAYSDNNIGYMDSGGITAGQTYVFSAYVYIPSSQAKNFEGKIIRWGIESANSGSTYASADVKIVDRWQRVFGTCVPTGVNAIWVLRTNANVGSFFYTDCWQFELGSFPTSYMPASGGSQFTRSADNASMTGTNFSSWYNSSEGTLYANAKSNANTLNNQITGIAAINNSSSPLTNRVDLRYHQSGGSQTNCNGVGGGGFSIARTSGFSLTNPKFAVSYAPQNVNFCVNSSLISSVVVKAAAFVPSPLVDRLLIGTFDSGITRQINGTISRLTYYPLALTDEQLINLTS